MQNVALVNDNTHDASIRIYALAKGGSEEACLDASLKKTKATPVRKYNPVSETREEEVVDLKLPTNVPTAIARFRNNVASMYIAPAGAMGQMAH